MDETRFDPLVYLSVLNRRKWWFVVPLVLALLVGAGLVWTLPRAYRSTTILAVTTPRMAANLVNSSANADKSERLRAISQQLLSGSVLERVVREQHLGDGDDAATSQVNRLRRSIGVTPSDSLTPGSTGALSAEAKAQLESYELTYVDSTPDATQRILNAIATTFVDENSRSRETRAQDTSAFLGMQLEASAQRLSALEANLRAAKESYMGRLPEQTNANLQMVSTAQRQLESNSTTMRGEQDRLSLIERQIQSVEQGIDDSPMAGSAPVLASQSRVLELKAELGAAQLNFTDRHPEVIRLKEELATAERNAAGERTRPLADRMSVLQANPEYRALIKDRETTRLRIADLQRQQAGSTADIQKYQARVESAPRVEQELQSLQRDYDLERASYADLTQKKQAALLNEDLQTKQGGEQFSVLVPANLPGDPFEPRPGRVLLMALAAGMVIGGAGVMGREYLDRSVRDAQALRDGFELPVLGEIPRIVPVLG